MRHKLTHRELLRCAGGLGVPMELAFLAIPVYFYGFTNRSPNASAIVIDTFMQSAILMGIATIFKKAKENGLTARECLTEFSMGLSCAAAVGGMVLGEVSIAHHNLVIGLSGLAAFLFFALAAFLLFNKSVRDQQGDQPVSADNGARFMAHHVKTSDPHTEVSRLLGNI